MKSLMTAPHNAPTMSSVEIATLTSKEHPKVTADIKRVLEEVGINPAVFGGVYLAGNGQEQPCFNLPRRECDLIIAGYSAKYRLAIIDRWHELEAQTAPRTYIQALQALIESEQAKELAIRTKAEIGSRREASAMNTASTAVKKVKALEIQLDTSKSYCTIKRAEMLYHGQKFNWRLLKSACNDLGIESTDVFDSNYGTVKAYPVAAWLEAYALDVQS